MKYNYSLLTAALCGLLSLPAFAGVTDIDEGGSTSSHTTVVNHYKTNEGGTSYTTVQVDGGTQTVKGTNTKVDGGTNVTNVDGGTVKVDGGTTAHITAYEWVGGSVGWKKVDTFDGTVNNASDLSKKLSKDYTKDGAGDNRSVCVIDGSYNLGSKQGLSNYGIGNSDVVAWGGNGTPNTSNAAKNLYKNADKKTTTDKVTTTDKSKSKSTTSPTDTWSETTYETVTTEHYTPYTLASSHTTFTGVTTTDGGSGYVAVGDPDDLVGTGHIASGHATYNYRQDDYYERDHYFVETTYATTTTYNKTDKTTTTTTNVVNTTTKYKTTVHEVNVTITYSPIVLDLDGDGKIEASNGQYLAHTDDMNGKLVMFDLFGNNYPVLTEWVGANDGLLCKPAADGTVNGSNLFGNLCGFEDGFEQMSAYDANEDGVLSGEELKDLRVWTDVNGDAIAQAGELKTLDELGITSLSVNHNNYKSTFVRNGKTYSSFDWWPTYRDTRKVDLSAMAK